jgi:hypothetical protein
MKTVNVLLLLSVAYALAGCDVNDPPPPKNAVAQPAAPLPNSNIFSTQVRALEKAKRVEDTLQKSQQNADKALQDSGG